MSALETVEVRLPARTVDYFAEVARDSGRSVDDVIAVVLAMTMTRGEVAE